MLALENERCRIEFYSLKRQAAIDQHAAAWRLGAQDASRHFSRYRLKRNAGAKLVAEVAQFVIEIRIAAVEDMVGAHAAQEFHLLSTAHDVDHGKRELLPEPNDHATERT